MGFSADLAARALRLTLGEVPARALEVAKATLLDTLAVALAGRDERVSVLVRAFVASETTGGGCSIWGTSDRAGPALAALANGTAAHALDFDDVCWAMNAHPSAVLWPAAIAVAESIGASGKDALLGYVAAFEAQALLGELLGEEHYAAGWHPTSTLGTLGAAVAAGKVLKLDASALTRAIGIACSEASGSRMNFGTDSKPFHAGRAAQAGVTAALLARSGMTAREDGIEAPMGLVELYAGESNPRVRSSMALLSPGVDQKPYPSCRFTHRIIDAVTELRRRRGARTLAELRCALSPFAERILIYPRPANGLEAKFSMPYCAAVAWLDGPPSLASFSDERACLSDVQALVQRVAVGRGSREAESATVVYTDGTSDTETVVHAKGSPARPLTRDERREKTRVCLGAEFGERIDALVSAVESIEELPQVARLVSLLATRP